MEECDDRLDFGILAPAHPHLKHLKLIGVVSDQRLRFILNHTPALHTLRMDGELEWLHDATFTAILETNPLPNLEVSFFCWIFFSRYSCPEQRDLLCPSRWQDLLTRLQFVVQPWVSLSYS